MPRRNTGARLKWFPDRGAWYITWTVNHRSHKRSTGTASREEADLILAEFLQTRSRTAAGASDPSKVLITDCLTLYAEERGPDVMGKETLGRAIVNLTAFWTENVVTDVTPQTCKRYATARGVGDGTVRRELGVLQAATNHAFKEGRITRKVPVHLPSKPESKVRWLTRSEAARLIRASRTPEARSYMPKFILMGLYTGRRKEAILSLRWPMVDLDECEIDFEIPGRKITKKRRGKCPVPTKLLPHLRRWKAMGGDMGFVINRDGKPLADIKKGFEAACRRAGLGDDVTPHTLKHTAISWRLQAGKSIWDVSGFFATSVKTIADTYGHHSQEQMRETADAGMARNGALKGAQRVQNRRFRAV